jgi:hypothetical protein
MKKKTFLVTMLAVVAFATNVFATEAEAGVLGLKPSANQSVTQSQSGNTANAANTDVQNVQYDTTKYQFPAQQLKAEGKNFNKYDWRLFQRFDTGELMIQAWADGMNWHIREYSNNTFSRDVRTTGKYTYAFDFREEFLSYFDKEYTMNGMRKSSSDNEISFVRNDSVNVDIPVRMNVDVHVKPENCYPRGTRITVPGAMHHNGSGEPIGIYQELYWENASSGQTTNETVEDYNAKYGHAIDPVKLYYPTVDRALYVSGWCLDDVAKYMSIIDSVYLDENPENTSHYTYLLHYKLRSLEGMKKVN